MAARLTADKEAGPAEFEPQLVGPVIVTYLQGLWRMALVSCESGLIRTAYPRFPNRIGTLRSL